ncbi:uncharacterized protein K02A2.6-like [Aricia agestis]|uniref:uncharacterized protein K02A2.6-like n=1 Tax=Aricia agestis TaxID=91739 RepID=UPI001C201AFF|nr:uncharacterized protein K02A2.6-like [Aricia agestis]
MFMREYCWWPGLGLDIEKIIASCDICQATRNFTNSSSLTPWKKTENNFERVHVDFFYIKSVTYLLIIDSRSRWLDVHIMQGTTALHVITKLCKTFAFIGVPAQLVSDNGPPFSSVEFVNFLIANGCEAVKTPPYHPQSNGTAERMVQTIKKCLVRLENENPKLCREIILQNFLFTYRNSPNVTGMSPNEILFKQRPRTRFDLMKPNNIISKKSCKKGVKTIITFKEGEKVWCKELSRGKGWVKGVILKQLSTVRYIVSVEGVDKYYHVSSLRPYVDYMVDSQPDIKSVPESKTRTPENEPPVQTQTNDSSIVNFETGIMDESSSDVSFDDNLNCRDEVVESEEVNDERVGPTVETSPASSSHQLRRSSRVRKPPDRLDL